MAGGITYEGALAGPIFMGLRFFISMRTPGRDRLIPTVKEHGGVIVKLEKLADILIADPLQRDVPLEALSWKFIEKSVTKGALEPREAYRIHRAPPASASATASSASTNAAAPAQRTTQRHGRSSAPLKTTRTPFTGNDDRLLAGWLAQMEAAGEPTGGNKIFIDFAALHPHHTWQSWKARCRILRFQPRPSLPAVVAAQADPSGTKSTQEPSTSMPHPSDREKPQLSAPVRTQAEQPILVKSRLRFSLEDDELLTKYVEEAAAHGKPINGNKMYMQFAEEHPHHSYHSWRDRWVRHLGVDQKPKASERPARAKSPDLPPPKSAFLPGHKDPLPDTSSVPRVPVQQTEANADAPAPLKVDSSFLPGHKDPLPNTSSVPRVPVQQTEANSDSPAPLKVDSSTAPAAAPAQTGALSEDRDLPQPSAMVPATERVPHVATQLRRMPASSPSTEGFTPAERLALKLERKKHQEKAVKMIERLWQGKQVRSALRTFDRRLVHLQSSARGFITRTALSGEVEDEEDESALIAERPEEPQTHDQCQTRMEVDTNTDIHKPCALPVSDEPYTPKEEFYIFLNAYIKGTGHNVNHWPTIQGRTLDLWEVWNAVTSLDEGRPASTRSWEAIAETLGYDWLATPRVTSQLKDCYSKNLNQFEAFLKAFQTGDLVSEDGSDANSDLDVDMEAEQQVHTPNLGSQDLSYLEAAPPARSDPVVELAANPAVETQPDLETTEPEHPTASSQFPSSPPQIRGVKRAYLEEPPFSPTSLRDTADKTSGVFSDVYGTSRRKRARYDKDVEIPSTPEEKTGVSRQRPVYPQSHGDSSKRLEPETQDFAFGDDFQSQPDLDESPSQQVTHESQQISPIPYTGLLTNSDDGGGKARARSHSITSSPQIDVVLDSAAARPEHGYVSLPHEDEEPPVADKALTPVQENLSSPVRVKRRFLPQSFKSDVTPPAITTKHRVATGSQRVPHVIDKGKETVASVISLPRQSLSSLENAKSALVPLPARRSMPVMEKTKTTAASQGVLVRTRQPTHFVDQSSKRSSETSLAPRQSRPTDEQGTGKAVAPSGHGRRNPVLRQTKSGPTSVPPSTAPAPKPSAAHLPPSVRKKALNLPEIKKRLDKSFDKQTVMDVIKATNARLEVMDTLLNKVEKAEREKRETDLAELTESIPDYWRKKDDIDLGLLSSLEGKSKEAKGEKAYVVARTRLERRFGRDGIRQRRIFLKGCNL